MIYKLIFCFLFSSPEAMNSLNLSINHHLFYLEVPENGAEYSQGLMYRHSLPSRHGMIFLFNAKDENRPKMWMKNTYIALDMLFIDSQYKIVCILTHTKPLSLQPLGCDAPAIAVIELNAGEVDRFHIVKGMALESEHMAKNYTEPL